MVTAVMVEGRSNVPPVDCMCGEGGSGGGQFVDTDFGARRSKGIHVEVKVPVDGCVGRKARVYLGRSE